MAIPKSFSVLQRWLLMTAHVYKDRDIAKAQYIVFAPKYLLYYDITTATLKYLDFKPSTPMTIDDIESRVNTMLNALYPDEEMMHFNADVTNYITKDIYQTHDIDWADMSTPVYDESFLESFHNADFLPYSSVENLDIVQQITQSTDSIVVWNPTFTTSEIGVLTKRVVDFSHEDPSADEVIRNTRWKFTVKLVGNLPTSRGGTFKYQVKSCGSELLINPQLYIYDSQTMQVRKMPMSTFINVIDGVSNLFPSGAFSGFTRYGDSATPPTPGNSFGTDFNSLVYLSKFNRAPLRYLTAQNAFTAGFKNVILNTLGEIGSVSIIEDEQLDAIHRECLLSAFGVNPGNEMR